MGKLFFHLGFGDVFIWLLMQVQLIQLLVTCKINVECLGLILLIKSRKRDLLYILEER